MSRKNWGFTLIELIMVAVIAVILASIAVSAYQTYTVRAQVSEAIDFASGAKAMIVDAYLKNSSPPLDRIEAGMTQIPANSSGSYVADIAVVNGRIDVTFGNRAHQDIAAETLSLTPYFAPDSGVVWRCGSAPAPEGAAELTGSGITSEHRSPTVDSRYLPSNCR